LTRWRIADHFRKQPPAQARARTEPGSEDRTATIGRMPDPAEIDAFWELEWMKNLFETAIARLSRRVNPKHMV
jgi:hypothetical protein